MSETPSFPTSSFFSAFSSIVFSPSPLSFVPPSSPYLFLPTSSPHCFLPLPFLLSPFLLPKFLLRHSFLSSLSVLSLSSLPVSTYFYSFIVSFHHLSSSRYFLLSLSFPSSFILSLQFHLLKVLRFHCLHSSSLIPSYLRHFPPIFR